MAAATAEQVWDESRMFAERAEALSAVESELPEPIPADDDGYAKARYLAHVEQVVARDLDGPGREVAVQLAEEPFTAAEPPDEMGAPVKGFVESRWTYSSTSNDEPAFAVFHEDPDCVQAMAAGRGSPLAARSPDVVHEKVEGSAEWVAEASQAGACGCATTYKPVAEWVGQHGPWRTARDEAATALASMQHGQPADDDAVWGAVSAAAVARTVQNPRDTSASVSIDQTKAAHDTIGRMSRLAAQRARENGALKAAEYDASVYIALSDAARRATSEDHREDLLALRRSFTSGTPVSELAERTAGRRDTLFQRRRNVEARLGNTVDGIIKDASDIYNRNERVDGGPENGSWVADAEAWGKENHSRVPPYRYLPINGVGNLGNLPLARRVLARHEMTSHDLRARTFGERKYQANVWGASSVVHTMVNHMRTDENLLPERRSFLPARWR